MPERTKNHLVVKEPHISAKRTHFQKLHALKSQRRHEKNSFGLRSTIQDRFLVLAVLVDGHSDIWLFSDNSEGQLSSPNAV